MTSRSPPAAGADGPTRHRRISYSQVPFQPSWAARLALPVTLVSNLAVVATVYIPWRTARVRWTPPLDDIAGPVADGGRPLIYYSWHKYEPFLLLAFRDIPARLTPHAIGHDGIASRSLQHAVSWFGVPVWVYRRRSPVTPTEQIIRLLREQHHHVALVPDAGGPYGRIKPGLAEIANAVDAWVIPVVVRAQGRFNLPRPWRYGFPLPFCSVDVYAGEPFEGNAATVDRYQHALDALETRLGGG